MSGLLITVIYIIIGLGSLIGSGYIAQKIQNSILDLKTVYSATEVRKDEISDTMGKKRISGIVEEYDDTVYSPLRGEEVIAYQSKIDNTSGAIKSSIFEQQDSTIFRLVEGDEEVLVNPKNADLYLEKNFVPLHLDTVQSIISQKTSGHISSSNIEVKEGRIKNGDSVFMYGEFDYISDDEVGKAIQTTSDNEFVISDMKSKRVQKILAKETAIYITGTLALFISGIIILGFGFSIF
jgi:hypothetical protein